MSSTVCIDAPATARLQPLAKPASEGVRLAFLPTPSKTHEQKMRDLVQVCAAAACPHCNGAPAHATSEGVETQPSLAQWGARVDIYWHHRNGEPVYMCAANSMRRRAEEFLTGKAARS